MAASHHMVEHDVARIAQISRNFKACQIIEVTNKRTIMWCPDLHCAKNLAIRINADGYQYDIRKGMKSDAYYVQAWY